MCANWTRRQVLRRGGAAAAGVAGLGLAGYIGYSWPHPASTEDAPPAPVPPPARNAGAGTAAEIDHFVTRSDIRPPAITVTQAPGGASQPPYIFVAPRGYTSTSIGQSGLMIVDRDGGLV
ncbi:MAG TPA: twin-arginine translocation signal domain-containing protein, partial [Streptosporangiaceae bacterium]